MFYFTSVAMNNTTPTWLYPCICTIKPCHCLTRLNPNIIIIITTISQEKTTHYSIQNSNLQLMEFTFYQDHNHVIAIKHKIFMLFFWILIISNIGGHSRWHQMVCHTHCPHNKHPRRYSHGQYYHPIWTKLHSPNAHPYMHAMNPLNSHLGSSPHSCLTNKNWKTSDNQ